MRRNGYPEVIIISTISKKIARFYQPVKEGPQNCPVYLILPWIGNISLKFEEQVKSDVQNCFSAVEPRVVFQTRKILPSIHKDAVPITKQSLLAAVIVVTWVAHPKDYRRESLKTFPNEFETKKRQHKFYLDETAKPRLV